MATEENQLQKKSYNKKIIVLASIVITLLIVTLGYYVFTIRKSLKVTNQPIKQITDNSIVTSTENVDLKNYSLVDYPLKESPVYSQLDKDCFDPYWNSAKDTRLVKDGAKVLIPSLLQIISSIENQKRACALSINVFSIPADGNRIYISTMYNNEKDGVGSAFNGLYSIDIPTLTVKKLMVNQILSEPGLFPSGVKDRYILLPDGKRLIAWNTNDLYLINLETDSKMVLYKTTDWFVSKIENSMGQKVSYGVKVDKDKVLVGVYSKKKTADDYSVKIDKYGNVTVDAPNWDFSNMINLELLENITMAIPKSVIEVANIKPESGKCVPLKDEDPSRRARICSFTIIKDKPPYSFYYDGFERIQIYDDSDKYIQTIERQDEKWSGNGGPGIAVGDSNFDGINELALQTCFGNGGSCYTYFLLDSATGLFATNQNIFGFPDPVTKEFSTSWSTGCMGLCRTDETYRFENNKTTLIRTKKSDLSSEDSNVLITTISEYKDGKVVASSTATSSLR